MGNKRSHEHLKHLSSILIQGGQGAKCVKSWKRIYTVLIQLVSDFDPFEGSVCVQNVYYKNVFFKKVNIVLALIAQSEPDLWFYKTTHPGNVHLRETVCLMHWLQSLIYIYNHIISILKLHMLINPYYSNLKGPILKVQLPHYLILEEKKFFPKLASFSFKQIFKSLRFFLFLGKSVWQESCYSPITHFPKLEWIHWCCAREEHRTKHQI